mgnify:CR=1 FL=1
MIYFVIYIIGFFGSLYFYCKNLTSTYTNKKIILEMAIIWPFSVPCVLLLEVFDKFLVYKPKLEKPFFVLINKWRNNEKH